MTMTETDNMRMVSWNVNGIRARWPRLMELLTCEQPDVVCLQETRCSEWHFPSERLREMGYRSRHSPGSQQGGGVAILVREDHPITERSVELDHQRDIAEGHWIELTTEGITIVSVYVPAGAGAGELSDAGKLAFLEAVARHACNEHSRPLLIAGDFNVCPTDEDLAPGALSPTDALVRPESRGRFHRLLWDGLTDAVRAVHPHGAVYTFWDYQAGAWQKNNGIRIDHLLLSPQAADRLISVEIDKAMRGRDKASDHTPIRVELAA